MWATLVRAEAVRLTLQRLSRAVAGVTPRTRSGRHARDGFSTLIWVAGELAWPPGPGGFLSHAADSGLRREMRHGLAELGRARRTRRALRLGPRTTLALLGAGSGIVAKVVVPRLRPRAF